MDPIGILGLQGDFEAHRRALEQIDVPARIVRRAREVADISALILPGGESTTLLKLAADMGFIEAMEEFHGSGRPIFGTCAGAILLAREVTNPVQASLGFIDIGIERNAYGRQKDSFQTSQGVLSAPSEAEGPLEMIFIRAPRIRRCGAGVAVLARHAGEPVLVREGTVLAATFHPEIGRDRRIHAYFARMSVEAAAAA